MFYGDIRDRASIQDYFKSADVRSGGSIDAQTFAGIADDSLDFVISAHVIEHLRDPIGCIVNAIRVLRPAGVHILVVPDMRFTFDRERPETTVEHALRDYRDGGESTCRQAYEEHLRYVHPVLTSQHYTEAEIESQADGGAMRWRELDVHFHAWTRRGFESLLAAAANYAPFVIEEAVSVVNENIFVLRKRRPNQIALEL
jgi:SAM-dependent methyltransferase